MSFEVQYAGVRLIGIQTTGVHQTPRRDDSNTDLWFMDTDVGVSTIVNAQVFAAQNQILGVVGNRVQAGSAAEIARNAQARLGQDRQPFKYIVDDTVVLESDATKDADNGPKIISINIRPMGANSIKIELVVRISRVPCTENPTAVIGNRWRVVDDIGDDWRVTRTWQGKLRLCNAVHNPQAFREFCVPVLNDGWRRVKMHFTGELNALELSYEIVDRQLLGDAAPAPAVKMAYTHSEALNRNGASSIGEVYVRLDGPPGTDKQVLLEQCMRVINSKVQADRFAKNSGNWLWHELLLTDYGGEDVCAVDARARVQRALNDADAKGPSASLRLGNLVTQTLGQPLDLGGNYNRFKTVPPALYPTTTIGLFAAHLQCPCDDNHRMPQAGQQIEGGGSVSSGGEEPSYEVTYDPSGSQLEIESPGYSSQHEVAMYTHSALEVHFDEDEGIVKLPYGDQLPKLQNTAAFIRLHAPTANLIIKLSAERIGAWPQVPAKTRFTDANGIAYVPLKYRLNCRPVEFQGDGSKLHTVDLEAVWGMSRAPAPGQHSVPALPWDDLPPSALPSSSFTPVFASK